MKSKSSKDKEVDPTKNEAVQLEQLAVDKSGIANIHIQDRPAKEKVLLRKIDMRMMPLMMLICTFRSALGIWLIDLLLLNLF